jgi:hypothetical protein
MKQWQKVYDAKPNQGWYWLTAAGTVPDFHRIPFSFCLMPLKQKPNFGVKV